MPADDASAAYLAHRQQQAQATAFDEMLARVRARGAAPGTPPASAGTGPAVAAEPVAEGVGEKVGGVARDVGRGVIEAPVQIVGGALDAVGNSARGLAGLADWLDANSLGFLMVPGHRTMLEAAGGLAGAIPAAKTVTGGFARGAAQFLTGFIPAMRATRGFGVARGAAGFGAGAIADFAVFDPMAGRLADLWKDWGLPENVVSDYLASDPGDSEIEGRFKNALEGAGLGVLTEGVGLAAGFLRGLRRHKPAKEGAPDPFTPKVTAEDLKALGDPSPEAPLVTIRAEGAKLKRSEQVTAEGVPALAADERGKVYINFARIEAPGDIEQAMQDLADAFRGDIEKQRRGVRTHLETSLAAEQIDAWKVLMERRTGQPLNAEQSLAARQLWVQSGTRLSEAAKTAATAPSEANLFIFRKMLAVHHAIQSETIAARTETARALNSWRIPAGGDSEKFRAIDDMLRASGGPDVSRELARRIAALDPAKHAREIDEVVRKGAFARTRDAVIEAWVMGLLSGPKTHLVNSMSNTAFLALNMLERGAAARIRAAIGGEGGVAAGEASAMLFGLMEGMKDAFRFAWKAARTGETGFGIGKIDLPREPALSSEALGIASSGWLGRGVDVLGEIVRVPGRALGAADELFKTVGYRMELNAQALRQATGEVQAGRIAPERLKERIAEIVADPPENIRLAAVDQALYQTFTQAPGEVGKLAHRMVARFPLLRFIVPFVNTPVNLTGAFIERLPIVSLALKRTRADLAAGGARRDLALARQGLGAMAMLTVTDLAMNGVISGGGPAGAAQRQALERTGWQPYSVKIGDRWYSYRRLDPIGMLIGAAADLVELLHNTDWEGPDAPDAEEVAIAVAAAIANNIMSKTWLTGISEFVAMLDEPDRYAETYFGRFAGSFVPTGVAEIARVQDPIMREALTLMDSIRKRTPGLSEGLPPRRDLWGAPRSYESGMGWAWDAFSPIYSRRENPEPIDAELLRLERGIAMPDRKASFDGATVDLERHPGAYSRYVELAGDALKHPAYGMGAKELLNAIVTGKHALAQVYRLRSDGPDGGKQDYIMELIGTYREWARRQLLEEFPALRAEVEEKLRRKRQLRMPVLQ